MIGNIKIDLSVNTEIQPKPIINSIGNTNMLKWNYPRKFFIEYAGPNIKLYYNSIFDSKRALSMHRYAIHAAGLEVLSKKSNTLYAFESGVNNRKIEGMSTLTIAQYLKSFSDNGFGETDFFSVDLGQATIDKS